MVLKMLARVMGVQVQYATVIGSWVFSFEENLQFPIHYYLL